MPRVTITVPEGQPQPYRFDLDTQSVSIGRNPESDILPTGGACSVDHAVMERVSGGFILRDLNSTNGTKLNGQDMDVIDLKDGMTALLGNVDFHFELSDEEKHSLLDEEFKPSQRSKGEPEQAALPKKIGKGAAPAQLASQSQQSPTLAAPRSVAPPPQMSMSQPSSSGGMGGLAAILITAACVALGLALRHNKETGSMNFIEAFQQTEVPASAK